MSTHNHLATGEFTGPLGAKRADSQWQALKNLLKDYGPDRTIEQWKQTWKDLKKGARNENAAAARGRSATGNVTTVPAISELSTKVLSVIGLESSTGIGPEESIIGQSNENFEVPVVEYTDGGDNLDLLPTSFIVLPPSTSFIDELENIPPAPSTSYPTPSTSNPATSTSYPTPSTSNPAPSTSNPTPSTSNPATSTSYPTPSTSNPAPSTSNPIQSIPPSPSTSYPIPSSAPAHRKERPHEAFHRLQHENNAMLQSIDERLKERNILLREQNQLLRHQNTILSQKNKLKRLKRFSRRF